MVKGKTRLYTSLYLLHPATTAFATSFLPFQKPTSPVSTHFRGCMQQKLQWLHLILLRRDLTGLDWAGRMLLTPPGGKHSATRASAVGPFFPQKKCFFLWGLQKAGGEKKNSRGVLEKKGLRCKDLGTKAMLLVGLLSFVSAGDSWHNCFDPSSPVVWSPTLPPLHQFELLAVNTQVASTDDVFMCPRRMLRNLPRQKSKKA